MESGKADSSRLGEDIADIGRRPLHGAMLEPLLLSHAEEWVRRRGTGRTAVGRIGLTPLGRIPGAAILAMVLLRITISLHDAFAYHYLDERTRR